MKIYISSHDYIDDDRGESVKTAQAYRTLDAALEACRHTVESFSVMDEYKPRSPDGIDDFDSEIDWLTDNRLYSFSCDDDGDLMVFILEQELAD